MFNILNAAATGMTAQAKQVEVITNNIANADTVGFKRSRAEFQDLLYRTDKDPGAATSATTQSPTGIQIGAGAQVSAVAREHTDGAPRYTGRDLDVAMGGAGFLAVQRPGGEIAYTRDGSLQRNADGALVTSQGFPIVPEITIPPNARVVNISGDGRVTYTADGNEPQEAGQIQLVMFTNPAGLAAEGGNLLTATTASGTPAPGNPGENGAGMVLQKHLESSNVNPVTELTDLMRTQRAYDLTSKAVMTGDQMLQTLNAIK